MNNYFFTCYRSDFQLMFPNQIDVWIDMKNRHYLNIWTNQRFIFIVRLFLNFRLWRGSWMRICQNWCLLNFACICNTGIYIKGLRFIFKILSWRPLDLIKVFFHHRFLNYIDNWFINKLFTKSYKLLWLCNPFLWLRTYIYSLCIFYLKFLYNILMELDLSIWFKLF